MEVELSYVEALTFRRAVAALRSVCRDVRVSAHLSSLHLEGLNDSRTAWMQIAFSRCFFSSFRVRNSQTGRTQLLRPSPPPGAPYDGEREGLPPRFEATVNVKQLLRAMCKVGKRRPRTKGLPPRCISADREVTGIDGTPTSKLPGVRPVYSSGILGSLGVTPVGSGLHEPVRTPSA